MVDGRNLKTTKYRNGDVIYFVTDSATWGELSTAAYCYYDDIKTNSTDYGALYNWYAVNDSRNIAPAGWHVPTDDDWKELEMYLGMSQSEADDIDYRGTDEGGNVKETGTEHWNSQILVQRMRADSTRGRVVTVPAVVFSTICTVWAIAPIIGLLQGAQLFLTTPGTGA